MWCEEKGIALQFIQLGKPMRNAHTLKDSMVASGKMRWTLICFENLNQVRRLAEEWIGDYNHHRLHDVLDGMSPADQAFNLFNNEENFDVVSNFSHLSLLHERQNGMVILVKRVR
ncbi:MAG: integrase core domain-containing protein [Chryseotalea sp. WA131a]|nr:MAG: integrase core domain-containing protein [Chryseotalea sp. WA131a]